MRASCGRCSFRVTAKGHGCDARREGRRLFDLLGIQWRTAHAYGLARIFNDSSLTADEIKVREISADIAVVHARMTLSGQTSIGAIEQPGSRTNIFSFVVHRTGAGWLCAAAHNTDVIPQMETNVVDDDGTYRAANYRTGKVS